MARRTNSTKRDIESYAHFGKDRRNNPPVGLVTPDTDPETTASTFPHDPHIDPQLTWAGKAEHTSFEVPTVSLHVHERIDPRTIIEVVRRRNGTKPQMSFFSVPEENPPLRQAIEFPRQVLFPMAGARDGWDKLAHSLKAEIDKTRRDAYRGTVSSPFEPGEHRRVAVKILDDRGVESLKIVELG